MCIFTIYYFYNRHRGINFLRKKKTIKLDAGSSSKTKGNCIIIIAARFRINANLAVGEIRTPIVVRWSGELNTNNARGTFGTCQHRSRARFPTIIE